MNKQLLILGTVFGLLSIILGAFAAHGLEQLIDEKALVSFKTGVRYQMYHAFLLLILGSTSIIKGRLKLWVYYLVLFGTLLFSGSIYGLATNDLSGFDFKTIALVTPLGGLLLISAWTLMLIGIIKTKVD